MGSPLGVSSTNSETPPTIHRAAQLLRAIASRGRDGARLVDLTQHTRLQQPTARRILKSLIAEGIVMQQAESRRYLLGHLVFRRMKPAFADVI